MKINTINSIEFSSICNYSCVYCPARLQKDYRPVGYMDNEVFLKILGWILHFWEAKTQQEVNLFGVGESLLNLCFLDMAEQLRLNLPRLKIHYNTNGKLINKENAKRLLNVCDGGVDVTGHNPKHSIRAYRILKKYARYTQRVRIVTDFLTCPNDWAGQVDWYKSEVSYKCPWLTNGQVAIMSNGDITTCCFDAKGAGVIGNILKDDLDELEVKPFSLCEGCHQKYD